mmetsp:Transcript_72030/g.137068  ORF Transcript_72030/g.137068 Transcript_72030/m.137068 type:complete len:129 (-) Transcript_72030:28-414(-)
MDAGTQCQDLQQDMMMLVKAVVGDHAPVFELDAMWAPGVLNACQKTRGSPSELRQGELQVGAMLKGTENPCSAENEQTLGIRFRRQPYMDRRCTIGTKDLTEEFEQPTEGKIAVEDAHGFCFFRHRLS